MLSFHVSTFRIQPLPRPELRKDPIIDRWVVISTDRLGRPQEFEGAAPPQPLEACPFCSGHEHLTLAPTYVHPAAGDWQVRVVPNTFPAVRGTGEHRIAPAGLFDSGPAPGVHEVVIACPQHETRPARLSPENVTEIFRAFRERMRVLKRLRPELYPLIFSNHKAAAGASLEHVHIQIVALPKVPDLVEREVAAGRKHLEKTGQCLFCDLIAQERREGARIVRETESFLAVTAFAGRFPCELWLLPRRHASHFENIGDALLAELGQVFWELLGALDRGLDDPAFNLIIHAAPPAGPALAEYHWHIEILPRLTGTAGFEWGTGMNINPVPPEQAAEYLRRQS